MHVVLSLWCPVSRVTVGTFNPDRGSCGKVDQKGSTDELPESSSSDVQYHWLNYYLDTLR